MDDRRIAIAYRAWAEDPDNSASPLVLLSLMVTEGPKPPLVENFQGNSAADARSIFRSWMYYAKLGADVFIDHTPVPGSDNVADFGPGTGATHDRAFRRRVAQQVSAGRVPANTRARIDGALSARQVAPGEYRVSATLDFYVQSMRLANGFFQESREALQSDPSVMAMGLDADTMDKFAYMRWNMGGGGFSKFLGRDMSINRGANGNVPLLHVWAFHGRVVAGQYDEPRTNAIRFGFYKEAFAPIFEGTK